MISWFSDSPDCSGTDPLPSSSASYISRPSCITRYAWLTGQRRQLSVSHTSLGWCFQSLSTSSESSFAQSNLRWSDSLVLFSIELQYDGRLRSCSGDLLLMSRWLEFLLPFISFSFDLIRFFRLMYFCVSWLLPTIFSFFLPFFSFDVLFPMLLLFCCLRPGKRQSRGLRDFLTDRTEPSNECQCVLTKGDPSQTLTSSQAWLSYDGSGLSGSLFSLGQLARQLILLQRTRRHTHTHTENRHRRQRQCNQHPPGSMWYRIDRIKEPFFLSHDSATLFYDEKEKEAIGPWIAQTRFSLPLFLLRLSIECRLPVSLYTHRGDPNHRQGGEKDPSSWVSLQRHSWRYCRQSLHVDIMKYSTRKIS